MVVVVGVVQLAQVVVGVLEVELQPPVVPVLSVGVVVVLQLPQVVVVLEVVLQPPQAVEAAAGCP